MLNWILFVLFLAPIGYYIFKLKNYKLNTKTMIVIALFTAVHFVLSKIQFVQYPQGGGFNLLASLPILLVGILYGPMTGMTCGLVSAVVSIIGGQLFIVHPAQFLLDYILPTMFLGLSGMFGSDTKKNILIGCTLAVTFKVITHVLSGCIYFSEYAPSGMNPLVYSLIYNITGEGIEGWLSSFVLTIIPLDKIRKMAKIATINKAS
ncbi:MAG: energy-coupled thiamine transporter ThiT [Terrisporobacter sp.]